MTLSRRITFSFLFLCMLAAASIVPIQTSLHAVARHGDDALAIRACIENKGPAMKFKSLKDPFTFYLVCQLDDGRWGLQALIKDAGKYFEKTAFVKGEGTLGELLDYMGKLATRFKGELP